MAIPDPQQDSSSGTLRDFFGSKEVEAGLDRMGEYIDSEEYRSRDDQTAQRLKKLPRFWVRRKIRKHAGRLFETSFLPAVVRAYARTGALAKYRDADPDEIVMVEVAEHAMESWHEPALDIVINGKHVGELVLEVDLRLEMTGLILKLRNKQILEATPGTCIASGTIAFHDRVLCERESGELRMGPIDLVPPIDIPEGGQSVATKSRSRA